MSYSNSRIRNILMVASAAALLATAGQASAHEPDKALSIDEIKVVEQLSASDARRRAYDYMASLGYVNTGQIGGARVRGITREGDTWIVRVAFSSGSRIMNRSAVLYIDAATAVVSEQPPKDAGRVAAN